MTGGDAAFGEQMKRGAEAAVADINAAGGVLGNQLKLEVGDDACDPNQARSVAEDLVPEGRSSSLDTTAQRVVFPPLRFMQKPNVLQITRGFDEIPS